MKPKQGDLNSFTADINAKPTRARAALQDLPLSSIQCHIDVIGPEGIHGWAVDQQEKLVPVLLHILVDGQEVGETLCDGERPDVVAAQIGPINVGLRFALPRTLMDGRQHELAIKDQRGQIVEFVMDNMGRHSITFSLQCRPNVLSCIDGLRNGGIEGWLLYSSVNAPAFQGNAIIRIEWNKVTVGYTRADRARSDVAAAHGAPANCGFRFVPPEATHVPGATTFRLFLMPDNIELEGSPYTTRMGSNVDEEHLLDIVQSVDRLEREAARLRLSIRSLLPMPTYGLQQYDEWMPHYLDDLRRRIVAGRRQARNEPMVSVVCPIYRPVLAHFEACVRSVLAQTYVNLELILVDDCSDTPQLSASIKSFAAADRRVRIAKRRRNGGISEATNTAIAAAKGEWVALVDHDDLLEDVALEAMVAALRPGIRLAYSDEDKVDETGRYVEPALKPDWNYRYLLGANYICHLTMLRRDLFEEIGPLRKVYDGAQDHDLFLRAAELLRPDEILHVPEILYHWRKTPQSTAASGDNKSYAAIAGARAVSDHLTRIGRPAVVKPVPGTTLYTQLWQTTVEPWVTVIVPYKDQLTTTLRCIDALHKNTAYNRWRLVLVDNWSTSADAVAFAEAAAKRKRTTVLRVEEPFNFSRLNNLATKSVPAEYYVFLNNDLFVTRPDWLRAAVSEAVVDDQVGIVGGKFLFPNGTVQHAGVVVGAGGIAGHSFVGIPGDDGGYCGRALVAQEVTAVTAAGMLVRAAAFNAVGGFDEIELKVAFNDVDLCLRVRQAGFRVIMTPSFAGEHHESLSRGPDDQPASEGRFFHEIETMRKRWGAELEADALYSRHFELSTRTYSELKWPKSLLRLQRSPEA